MHVTLPPNTSGNNNISETLHNTTDATNADSDYGFSPMQKHFLVVASLAGAILILGLIHCIITRHGKRLHHARGEVVMSLRQRSELMDKNNPRRDTKGDVGTHVAMVLLKKMHRHN